MLDLDEEFLFDGIEWMTDRYDNLPDTIKILKPSEWAEDVRYLPRSVTPLPGPFSWEVAPYLREILDNLDPQSPIREVDVMKGVQICATVGILENAIGYYMDHVKYAPIMMVTADDGLAKLRIDTYITPMIQHSGLAHLIKSADETNKRKTGKTIKKIEWEGGGSLVPFGAQNANKLRSLSIMILLCDEIDGWPLVVGRDGDPLSLVADRTSAYEQSRKILRLSTPLYRQTSKIYKEYKLGDKREYRVPCRNCGEPQKLVFSGTNDDGTKYGLIYAVEDGQLLEQSVFYVCKYCGKKMVNDDKVWMYRDDGSHCEWVPTAIPTSPDRRSYHLPAFYSPAGMQTWSTQVKKWIKCWDIKEQRVKDIDLLQLFYNNVNGRPFEKRGDALKYETIITHRRATYGSGMIPNLLAKKEGGKILFLATTVDVHKNRLDVQVIGWCRNGRFYSIEWLRFEGNCESPDTEPWERLRKFMQKIYHSDDGYLYRTQMTLIDSQYIPDTVYTFCSEYSIGVYPIAGRQQSVKGAAVKEFSEFTSKLGTVAYHITTSLYKDRLAVALKKEWDGMDIQPVGYPNFPQDYPEQFFKEFTAETKKERINKITGEKQGFFWYCPPNAANHSWDLTVYGCAAMDMIAWDTCSRILELESVDWGQFWEICEKEQLYFEKS